MTVLVAARTYQMYRDWMRLTGAWPADFRYVSCEEHLLGLRGNVLIVLPGWAMNFPPHVAAQALHRFWILRGKL